MARTTGNSESAVFSKSYSISGTAVHAAVVGQANPFGADVDIVATQLRITTASTGASTLDIGIGATATTNNDGQIDGASGAAAITLSSVKNAGTNGGSGQTWTTGTFLTVKEASGDATGLVGILTVFYIYPSL